MALRELIIATSNDNKFLEICSALPLPGVAIYSLRDFRDVPEAPETGSDFGEIARQKAKFYFGHFQKPVLAEDSGLVIPALDAFPGIYSARIAPNDETRIRLVLEQLSGSEDRRAYYVCDMVFMSEKDVYQVEGRCEGTITAAPRGSFGFGYDPIFLPEGSDRTFGEMNRRQKAQVSHRGQAAGKILPYLLDPS